MESSNTRKKQKRSPKVKGLYFLWVILPWLAVACVILVIITLAGIIRTQKEEIIEEKRASTAVEKKAVNAIVLELQPRDIMDSINLPGTIEPWTRLELMAKVSGAISEVMIEEGASVNKGDTLARIEEADYRIALDAASAAYKQAEADFSRDRAMLEKRVIPTANLENSETRLQTAKADLERAELMLSRCTITAPMGGIVKRLDAKVGLYLDVGNPIAELLKIDKVKAVVGIPESDVDAVRRISAVDITIQALGNAQFKGKKQFLSPAPDSSAYLYRLELGLENADLAILPGMFFRADVVKQRKVNAISVPLYAIISRNNKQYVYVCEQGIVRRQVVQLGIVDKWQVEITNGLVAGERVVVEGHRDVEDGQPVNVIKVLTDPAERLL